MSTAEQIQIRLSKLPPEKQSEVLDFVAFLQERIQETQPANQRGSLDDHPAFGSWKGRNIDGVEYQRALRAEWDERD
jgi:Protein of unknown function (DUF2281)